MIPLSIPHLNGNEWKYIKECLDTNWVSSVGAFVDRFEEALVQFTGAQSAVACVNGTAALHISLQLAGVRANDYVIVPNLTFVASVNAIKYCFADPILMDVTADSWQLDLDLLEEFLGKETHLDDQGNLIYTKGKRRIGAIMPVHVLGNMCDMARLVKICKAYRLPIVEDATEALGSYYDGQHAGTFGQLACLSFNGNKIITTGGGGIILTNDLELGKKAKHLTTQAKSHATEYIHDEIGYNYRLVNILAAMGVAQMEQLPQVINRKQEIADFYTQKLQGVGDIQFQIQPQKVKANNWLYTILTKEKQELLAFLTDKKIQARPFWMPMNRLKMYEDSVYIQHQDRAWRIYQGGVSIPCSGGITDDELSIVADSILDFYS